MESMGVASGRGYQEVGVASGWNLWVWLPCIGVASGCCCKEVYRYPHNNSSNIRDRKGFIIILFRFPGTWNTTNKNYIFYFKPF